MHTWKEDFTDRLQKLEHWANPATRAKNMTAISGNTSGEMHIRRVQKSVQVTMSQGLVWVSVRSSIHRQSMHVDHWEITSPTSITPLQPIQRKKSINNSNLSLVSSLHLSLTPYSHFSAVTEVKTQCANVCVRCRPIEKVKVLKWNQHRRKKQKHKESTLVVQTGVWTVN